MGIIFKSVNGGAVEFGEIKTITTTDLTEGPTIYGFSEPVYTQTHSASTKTYTAKINIMLTRVKRLMMLYELRSVREARLVIRHKERIRRWMLKNGKMKYWPTSELWAVCDVVGLRGRYRKLRSKSQSEM